MTIEGQQSSQSLLYSAHEPEYEKSIFGSSKGFTDSLPFNIELIQGKVNNPYFQVQTIEIGTHFKQLVALAYLEGQAQQYILERLTTSLQAIRSEPLLGTGQLEQLLKDFPRSPFPGFQLTELPELTKSALAKGKIVILLEGYPTVLIAPTDFFCFLKTTDDYNFNWLISSLLQFLRLAAMAVAIFLPAFYVAIISYHYYILPLNIIASLAESRLRAPFPPVIAMLLLEAFMEIFREGALRRGNPLALTGGIGVLLAGAGAISTGFLSPFSLMLSGITQIATLILPVKDMQLTARLLKFGALVLTGIFGILGTIVFASVTVVHLIVLESAGQPYFEPVQLLREKFHSLLLFCYSGYSKKQRND